MLAEIEAQKSVSEIFTDDTFKAFVYDFYHSLRREEEVPSSWKILEMVFSDTDIFREFLKYCRQNDCSFINYTEDSSDLKITLHIFDCLREINIRDIDCILNVSQKRVFEKMKDSYLDHQPHDLWEALQKSIDAGIPINNRGEVLYTIEETANGYVVYSYQSKLHEVDHNGVVIRDFIENKKRREVILRRIQTYKRFQRFISWDEIRDEVDKKLAKCIQKDFESQNGLHWQDIQGDEKGERLYMMKLRSYVVFQILDCEALLQKILWEPSEVLPEVVWWISIGDGHGKKVYPWEVPHNQWLIKLL